MRQFEFYHGPDVLFTNGLVFKTYDSENIYHSFGELTPKDMDAIWNTLRENPLAHRAMVHLRKQGLEGRREILKQFIECNWIAMDHKKDIDGDQLNFENVPCLHKGRGTCPFNGEGVVCVYNDT